MALASKLLDEIVVNLAKEMLKKVRDNAYVSRKLQAVIAAKKHGISEVARVWCISRTALTEWIKHLKFGRTEKLLKISENITYLPSYSPELNPVQRFWLYIKQHILRNKVYDTIALLESALCKFIANLSHTIVKQVCSTLFVPLVRGIGISFFIFHTF